MSKKVTGSNKFEVNERGVWHRYQPRRLRRVAPYIKKTSNLVRLSDGTWHVEFEFVDESDEKQTQVVSRPDSKKPQKLREALESRGYEWPMAKSTAEKRLLEYLAPKPIERIDWLAKTGWHNEATFVFQDSSIGPESAKVKFRPLDSAWRPAGTIGGLAAWREAFSTIARFSTSALLMCGTAFGGPFHQLLRIEPGGFNGYGPKSKGKTSSAAFAQSIYCMSGRDEVETWDTSETRLDELRCEHSDMVVYLDDMGRAGKDDNERIKRISDAAFRLTTGKPRGRSKGFKVDPNYPSAWVAVLSTSVRSLFAISAAAGSHVFGGEEVRLIDVPAVVSEELGIFDSCPPGYKNTRDAVYALEMAASKNYGVAGREYLRRIIEDRRAAIAFVEDRIKYFVELLGSPGDSEYRYVQRFALAYAGLELATKLGVVELPQGEALTAIKSCYDRARAAAPNFSKMLGDALSNLAASLSEQIGIIDLSHPGQKTTMEKFGAASGVLMAHENGHLFYAIKIEQLGKLSSSTLSPKHILSELKARQAVRQMKGGKSSVPTTVPGLGKLKRQRLVWIWKGRLNKA